MADLGTDQTIYCPAFPENGRSIFMGNLFVGRQPLAESPMKDHPLTPMRDSNLMRLLEPQVTKAVGLADRLTVAQGPKALRAELAALKTQGVAHVVVDAVANSDLDVIAEACRDMPLMTGGSAVAMPLPALYLADGTLSADAPKAEAPTLGRGTIVLSGSCSAMTNKQVADYISRGVPAFQLDPLSLAENGPQKALDWLARQDLDTAPLIYATANPDSVRAAHEKLGVAGAGEIVEATLSACAVAARDAGARRVIVAGGETSGAVTKALGVSQLDIGTEIAPGVPWNLLPVGRPADRPDPEIRQLRHRDLLYRRPGPTGGRMTPESQLREQICLLAKSMFDRGLTGGSTGNISARTEDGGLLVSPTGTSFGRLDPGRLSRFDATGSHIDGDKPTKEMPLHSAFYDTRSSAGAVVHLHSCHSVALSMMPDVDPDNFLPPLTPYGIMKLGKVKLLPFYLPGDPAMGDAVRGLAGKRTAVMLANHGPVVAGRDIEAACNAIEELEDTARLAMMTRGMQPRGLTEDQVQALVTKFDVEWDA